jgi:hypothetical protein
MVSARQAKLLTDFWGTILGDLFRPVLKKSGGDGSSRRVQA